MFTRKPPGSIASLVPANGVSSVAVSNKQGASANFVVDAVNSDELVVIGRGTRIVGEIRDCSRLEIQGTVEGSIVAHAVIIRENGIVKGELQAAQAEIHGKFEGRLDVSGVLDVRSSGRVEGDLGYGRLSVAMGGHVAGKIQSSTVEQVSAQPEAEAIMAPLNGIAHLHS